MDAHTRFALTRLVDEDGREWVQVPLDEVDDVPAALRDVAREWHLYNTACRECSAEGSVWVIEHAVTRRLHQVCERCLADVLEPSEWIMRYAVV